LKNSKDIIKLISNCLRSDKEVAAAYIFGSYAKNKQKKDSDIDVAILLKKIDTSELLATKINYSILLEDVTSNSVDVTILNNSNCILKNQIYKYGKLIIENEPGFTRNFKAISILEYIDFLPYRNIMAKGMKRFYLGGTNG